MKKDIYWKQKSTVFLDIISLKFLFLVENAVLVVIDFFSIAIYATMVFYSCVFTGKKSDRKK